MKPRYLILFFAILFCGIAVYAKTSAAKASAEVVGKFSVDGAVVSLLSDGKVKYNGKRSGIYSRLGDDTYKVKIDDDAWFVYLIEGNRVYEVGAGSAGVITDFDFDPSSGYLTVTEVDGGEVTDEDLESLELSSPEFPLSDLSVVSQVEWSKAPSAGQKGSGAEASDGNFLSIMIFCNGADRDYGPTGKTAMEIMKGLEAAGYAMVDDPQTNYFSIEDPITEEYYEVEAVYYFYTKGDVSVFCVFPANDNVVDLDGVPYEINVIEPESEMRKFAKDALTKGFVKESEDMGELYVAQEQPAGVSFNVFYGDDSAIQINFADSH